MNVQLKFTIEKLFHSDEKISFSLVQNLWSNYGSLLRVNNSQQSFIVKVIKIPDLSNHPRGWNSSISHNRKKKSYLIENNWYERYNYALKDCYFPRLITSGTVNEEQFLILEDLQIAGYSPAPIDISESIKLVIKWLASFHANYIMVAPKDLWKIGTYWHLQTRPEEFAVMDNSALKANAKQIDEKLNQAKYKTIIHGDAKLANFLFHKSENKCAAVDFQYVGGGVGVKDLAYFLSSVYEEDDLFKYEETNLDLYFSTLTEALASKMTTEQINDLEKEWRTLYSFAWCDFYRFLLGWSPGHYKINKYIKTKTQDALKCL